jgi:hypothetical protein
MLAAAISFLLCKNLLDGLGEISAKLRLATMRMLLGWAIAERAFDFSYTASIANSIVMLGEMSMTFMNEEIMSASSTTATTSALAATLMSTYQDCPVFRGCRGVERHGVRHSAPPFYLRRQYSCLLYARAYSTTPLK